MYVFCEAPTELVLSKISDEEMTRYLAAAEEDFEELKDCFYEMEEEAGHWEMLRLHSETIKGKHSKLKPDYSLDNDYLYWQNLYIKALHGLLNKTKETHIPAFSDSLPTESGECPSTLPKNQKPSPPLPLHEDPRTPVVQPHELPTAYSSLPELSSPERGSKPKMKGKVTSCMEFSVPNVSSANESSQQQHLSDQSEYRSPDCFLHSPESEDIAESSSCCEFTSASATKWAVLTTEAKDGVLSRKAKNKAVSPESSFDITNNEDCGVSLSLCSLPALANPSYSLPDVTRTCSCFEFRNSLALSLLVLPSNSSLPKTESQSSTATSDGSCSCADFSDSEACEPVCSDFGERPS